MNSYLNLGRIGWVDPRVREGGGGSGWVWVYEPDIAAFASFLPPSFLGMQAYVAARGVGINGG